MQRRLPAEWEPQDGVLLAWPHAETDWCDNLAAVHLGAWADGLKFLAVPGSPRYPVFGVSNRHCPVSALGSRLLENVAAGLAVLQGRPIVRAGLLP